MFFRGLPASTFKLHDDDEPAQNVKKLGDQDPLSKSAAKNKKRREAARKKKEDSYNSTENNCNPAPSIQGASNNTNPSSGNSDNILRLAGDAETDKKLRKLNEKLLSIQKLKQQQNEGKHLEKNQIDKIGKEKEIIMEIQKLQL